MTTEEHAGATSGVSRRDLLKRGAVVGVAAAWTIPIVQVVSMTPAHADTPSSPTGPPTNNSPTPVTTVPVSSAPPTSSDPSPSSAIGGVSTSKSQPTSASKGQQSVASEHGNATTAKPALAFTGANPLPALGIGAAAIALGAGAVAASHAGKSKPAEVVADPAE